MAVILIFFSLVMLGLYITFFASPGWEVGLVMGGNRALWEEFDSALLNEVVYTRDIRIWVEEGVEG